MEQESRLGRALWIGFLALLCIVVGANFARSPFGDSRGAAAVKPAQVMLWVPGPEAGGDGMTVTREAAAALELAGRRTAVKELGAGSSEGLADFLARRPARHSTALVVLTSSTFADLAHDGREALVPGVASQALLASALVRRSKAIGVLATEPLALAVPTGSPIDGEAPFLAALRRGEPPLRMALSNDSFSRVALAALVGRAGAGGTVRFGMHESGAVAVEATRNGEAGAVLAPRDALRTGLRSGRLRRLTWPLDHGRAPRSWVVVLAPPTLDRRRVADLRRLFARVTGSRGWSGSQARSGRLAVPVGTRELDSLPRRALARAAAEELVAERVEER